MYSDVGSGLVSVNTAHAIGLEGGKLNRICFTNRRRLWVSSESKSNSVWCSNGIQFRVVSIKAISCKIGYPDGAIENVAIVTM